MARPCSILLADASVLLREKIAGILSRQDDVWCVLQVGGLEPLLQGAELHQPDLVLADICLLRQRELVARLRGSCPGARLVAMVEASSEPYLEAARALGLDGVLEKSRVGEEIQTQIEALASRTESPDREQV